MGGSEVAPTLNSDGQSLYVAVNCSAKKIKVVGKDGIERLVDDPVAEVYRECNQEQQSKWEKYAKPVLGVVKPLVSATISVNK